MKNSKVKILQEQYFEEFELVNSDSKFAGISEKDVTAREIEKIDENGKQIKLWRIYANNMRIATINASGRIVLTEEYKEILKNEKSIGPNGIEITGERWLQAMVPAKDRFTGKDIQDMKERTNKDIEKINKEERIKEEQEKKNRRNITDTKNKNQEKKQPVKQQPKPQEVEKASGLPEGDVETCTLIKDKRF